MSSNLTLVLFLFFFASGMSAQSSLSQRNAKVDIYKDNAWEVGLHAGHFFSAGNVNFTPGYAGGIHIRRAMDYVFSWRTDLMFGSVRGEDPGNVRSFETNWLSGSLQGLMTMNNLKWSLEERRTNVYILLGVGLNTFSTDFKETGKEPGTVAYDVATHADIGAGIAFRINEQFNLGLEHKGMVMFGDRSDQIDGFRTVTLDGETRGGLRDVLHYTSFRINYNLAKKNAPSEPLYWLNPLDAVLSDLSNLHEFQGEFADEDQDGVFDKNDLEKGTLAGVPVNSRGQALDSDGDGVADYLDQEPFSPPGFNIDAYGVAEQPDILAEANKNTEEKIQALENRLPRPTVTMLTDNAIIDLSLPTIYFGLRSDNLGGKDRVELQRVADLMAKFPQVRLVVSGHADVGRKEADSGKLSYFRANAVIKHLTTKHGIPRSRFVLQYRGNSEAVSNYPDEANRRVQFKVATFESDMSEP